MGLCLALLPAVLPPVPASLLPAAIAQPVLRIGAIPDQNPEKLNRLYGLVADELSQQLGVKVAYVPVTDYAAAVSAFRTGSLDLVWFGGLTGVQASLQKPGAQMLAQRDIGSKGLGNLAIHLNGALRRRTHRACDGAQPVSVGRCRQPVGRVGNPCHDRRAYLGNDIGCGFVCLNLDEIEVEHRPHSEVTH